MITVGAFAAKTQLSSLLEQVAAGEEVLITKHGRPVARLIGAGETSRRDVDDAIVKLKALRAGVTVGPEGWKAMRDDGRR